ncbi:beta-glucoside-specific PTS transporter subunit IIABC [Dolosigranulum savutiense]|uniref:PTS system sucrose-specific EIIBCA component n=1 Tax=Dolosigranulum savutiense TaxID=3110288 RepID=A0AB74U4B3_9LACT
MGKYTELAKDIVEKVGGTENIKDVRHCITRLRFRLNNVSKADTDYLKQREGIVTVVEAGGQYQVVIGNHVPEVYEEVLAQGISTDNESNNSSSGSSSNGNFFDKFVDLMSSLFQPFLGVLTATGIIKGLVALLGAIGSEGIKDSGIYILLNASGDGFFQYLPIVLALTAATKFKLNKFTAIAIIGSLIYPNIGEQILEGTKFLGIPVTLPGAGSYYQAVVPAILAIWFASKIERLINKLIPDVLKMFAVPLITILISVPIIFTIVGPTANLLSNLLSSIFTYMYDLSPVLYGLIAGVMWQVLVMVGLHWAIIPMAINQLAVQGFFTFFTPILLVSFAQTGALSAILLKTDEPKVRQLGVPALISSLVGITEPAIYGITLPMKTPFIISCIAGAIQGAYLGFFNIFGYTMGGLGVFVYPRLINPETGDLSGVYHALIATVIAIVISFTLTYITKVPKIFDEQNSNTTDQQKQESDVEDSTNSNLKQEIIASPLTGKIVRLDDVSDEVFASRSMGDGIAILPTGGKVFAPTNGTVETLFKTGHAIGIKSDNGAEILIHIGVDTVQLDGEGFETHVSKNDRVEAGQLLIDFDLELVKEKGYDSITPIIITNSPNYTDILPTNSEQVKNGDYLIDIII